MAKLYRRLDPDIVQVHGEFELPPGEYKTGDLGQVNEGDILLSVGPSEYAYFKVFRGCIVYHRDSGPAVEYKSGYVQYWKYGKSYLP